MQHGMGVPATLLIRSRREVARGLEGWDESGGRSAQVGKNC